MTKLIVGLGVTGALVVGLLVLAGVVISCSNNEVQLRTTIEAKQKDNTSEFDNMFKKISQTAQVSQKQMDTLKDIFTSYADARTQDGGKSLMTWVQESIPNVDTATFNNLQNIITSSRDSWTMRQKELVDLHREHTKVMRLFPSGFILKLLGRKELKITVVTSTRTDQAFESGKDDDTKVF